MVRYLSRSNGFSKSSRWNFKKGERIKLLLSDSEYQIDKVGVFRPKPEEVNELQAGEVGFITANIKETSQAWVGDTIVDSKNIYKIAPLPGFKPSTR